MWGGEGEASPSAKPCPTMSCPLSFWSLSFWSAAIETAIESRAPPTLTSVILERSDGIHTFHTSNFQGQVFAYPLCGDTPQRPAPSCHPRAFFRHPRVGEDPLSSWQAISFNKSFPRCEHSLARHNDCSAQSCSRIYEIASPSPTQLVDTSCFRLTDSRPSTVRSRSPHLGQKTKKWLWFTSALRSRLFWGKNRFCRRKLL